MQQQLSDKLSSNPNVQKPAQFHVLKICNVSSLPSASSRWLFQQQLLQTDKFKSTQALTPKTVITAHKVLLCRHFNNKSFEKQKNKQTKHNITDKAELIQQALSLSKLQLQDFLVTENKSKFVSYLALKTTQLGLNTVLKVVKYGMCLQLHH